MTNPTNPTNPTNSTNQPTRKVYHWSLSREELEKVIALQSHYNTRTLNEALQRHLRDLNV